MFRDERLDPETVAPLAAIRAAQNGDWVSLRDIDAARSLMARLWSQAPKPPPVEGISTSDHQAPGPQNSKVFVRVYKPSKASSALPGLLWIHGGGYVFGNVERDDARCAGMAKAANCVVASVEYRLAPEYPYPAPLEDCYSALKWFVQSSRDLGVDKSHVAIGGLSAGGGLTAALALLTRDRTEVALRGQLLIYPMIDDRTVAPPDASTPDAHVWTRESNRLGWRAYLGRELAGKDVPAYAAAARAKELAGLPPAYVAVGDIDLFQEENVEYARRLLAAGVPTELHVYPGGVHGFNVLAPSARISVRFESDVQWALQRMLHGVIPKAS